MNESQKLMLRVMEGEGGPINLFFRDILDGILKRKKITQDEFDEILEAWIIWKGRLEEFLDRELRKFFPPKRFNLVIAAMFPRG